jgi:O-antigen/teichoic acid export membrane protein
MINKIFVLLVAGMPGLQRFLIFFLATYITNVTAIGEFSNDMNIILFMTFFTTIGWSGLLLIRIPKLEDSLKNPYLNTIIYNVLIYTFFASFLVIGLHYFELIYNVTASIFFLLVWSGYQVIRHFFISKREYKILFTYDLIVMLISIISILTNISQSILLNLSCSYMVVLIYFIINYKLYKPNIKYIRNDFIKSNHIGITNMINGSITILMVPLFNYYLGPKYAALIGITYAILSILLLFPRAMSQYYLPLFSEKSLSKARLGTLLYNFKKFNFMILIIIGVTSYFIMIFLANYNFKEFFELDNSKNIFLHILIYIIIAQFSLPTSNIMMALEKTYFLLKLNIWHIITISLMFGLNIVIYSNTIDIVLNLLKIIILSEIVRFVILNYHTNNILKKDEVHFMFNKERSN